MGSVIVIRMRSYICYSVIDVLRLVVGGEIVFAQSDDEIIFCVSAEKSKVYMIVVAHTHYRYDAIPIAGAN